MGHPSPSFPKGFADVRKVYARSPHSRGGGFVLKENPPTADRDPGCYLEAELFRVGLPGFMFFGLWRGSA